MLVVLIAGLFTFAFGGMVLILVLGARRIEDELTEREAAAREIRAEATRVPRFFLVTPPQGLPVTSRIDEALLSQLQRYVEVEQMLADEFVLQPSIESLYRQSERRLTRH